jgi:hypothetical protein
MALPPQHLIRRLWRRIASPAGARKALLLLVGIIGLGFLLHYRLPWLDQHPDWPEFPQTTNPRLVIEQIPDFEERYGKRFPVPEGFYYSEKNYSASVRNVRLLGTRIMSNEFKSGFSLSLGGNSRGYIDPYPTPSMQFSQRGYSYFELSLGSEKGYFKDYYYSPLPPMFFFYQYNYPRSAQDTLFLSYVHDGFRVYLSPARTR